MEEHSPLTTTGLPEPGPPLIAHLETFLGPLEHGWSARPDGQKMPFQVAEFRGGALDGIHTFATVGLSNTGLISQPRGKAIHMECIMALHAGQGAKNIPALLQTVGAMMLHEGRPIIRGEVIGPSRSAILNGTPFSALYAAMPVYWPDAFASVDVSGFTVIIAWLIPIMEEEAAFIHGQGWGAFENLLEESGEDLLDMERRSVIK